MSEAPERTHDNLPRRLIIGGEPNGPLEIYNDDREFLGRGRIAQAPPPGGTAFVRADVADEDKRQRDRLLAAVKAWEAAWDVPAISVPQFEAASELARAAIAECDAKAEADG